MERGRISYEQMLRLQERLAAAPSGLFKAVVMHHPIMPLDRAPGLGIVGRAEKALEIMERAGVGLVMAGHGHDDYVGKSTARYGSAVASILVAHAGTALSNRTRGARNGFNTVDIYGSTVELVPYEWEGSVTNFVVQQRVVYKGLGLTPVRAQDQEAPPLRQGRTFTCVTPEDS